MSKISPFIFQDSSTGKKTVLRKESEEFMTNRELIDDMDAAFPNGKYVEPSDAPPRIRFRDMNSYCERVGKEPFELTEEELNQFRY
nr:hypothetical protein [Lysinibacillus timonensis]